MKKGGWAIISDMYFQAKPGTWLADYDKEGLTEANAGWWSEAMEDAHLYESSEAAWEEIHKAAREGRIQIRNYEVIRIAGDVRTKMRVSVSFDHILSPGERSDLECAMVAQMEDLGITQCSVTFVEEK